MGRKVRSNVGLRFSAAPWVLAAGISLCATVQSSSAFDRSVTIRCLIWCGLSIVLFALIARRKDFSAFVNPAVLLFAGYWLCVVVSGFHAINMGEWLFEVFKAGMMTVFLFCSITVINRKITAGVLTVLAALLGVWGMYQLSINQSTMIPGLEGNRNQWAAALMLLVPFCFMTKFWPLALLPVANVFWLFARSSVLALGVMSLSGRKIRYAAAAAIVFAGLWYVNYHNLRNTESMRERGQQWRATLTMVKDNPFGVGAGNWKLRIPQYRQYFSHQETFETYMYTRPHNDYLWILAETSLPGLGFYAGAILYAFWCAYKKKDTAVAAGLAGYCTFAFFSFPMERIFHSVILMILIALAVKGPAAWKDKRHRRLSPSVWLLLIFVFAFLAAAMVDFNARHVTNCQSLAVRRAKDGPAVEKVLENISPLAQLDSLTSMPLHCFRAIGSQQAGHSEKAFDDMQKACRIHPYNSASLIAYAVMLHNIGRNVEARYYRDRAVAIAPKIEKRVKLAVKSN